MNVVTFMWGDKYRAHHVNRLRSQLDLYYPEARLICVTNQPEGITSDVEIVPDDEDFADMRSPHGGASPACYRRLRIWREDAQLHFGPRFVCVDLDVTAVADLRPLWDRPEPVVVYADPFYAGRGQVCGSMILLSAGAFPTPWRAFEPAFSPSLAKAAGFRGSDQAWLSYCLRGRDVPRWTPTDGVYSYRKDILRNGGKVPADARLIVYHGSPKPWDL